MAEARTSAAQEVEACLQTGRAAARSSAREGKRACSARNETTVVTADVFSLLMEGWTERQEAESSNSCRVRHAVCARCSVASSCAVVSGEERTAWSVRLQPSSPLLPLSPGHDTGKCIAHCFFFSCVSTWANPR
jgi:hypothetical protein